MNILKKTIHSKDLIKEFLNALNGLLRITPRELEVLVEIVGLEMRYVEVHNKAHNVVNSQNRKYLCKTLKLNRDNLSRYIKKFIDRGILIKKLADSKDIRVWHPLVPDVIKQTIQITLLLKLQNDRETIPQSTTD